MRNNNADSTIAAIATPPGPGGIGVIRVSGRDAFRVLSALFFRKNSGGLFQSHKLYYGWLLSREQDRLIDEVLVVYMKAPKTYTREDVVEIHCHSSFPVMEDILAEVLNCGARLAEPGEFTKRAFLNGRISLSQAEAVIELLKARTRKGRDLALSSLRGELQKEIEKIRNAFLSLKAIVEVAIDFPEDDVEILDDRALRGKAQKEIITPLERLIAAFYQGKIYREGIFLLILGKPNVGKSSLLNRLLKEERAIVSSVPGTTRDTIEECINVKGMAVNITDTAGIRQTEEEIEGIGVERARTKIVDADVVIFLLDGSQDITSEDYSLYELIRAKPLLLVVNKIDISTSDPHEFAKRFPGHPLIPVSALRNIGINELEQEIFNLVTGGKDWDPGADCVPNMRQTTALKGTLAAGYDFLEGLADRLTPDLLALDLQAGLDCLGDIVGETTTEDVLDVIFQDFCLGK
ncbi:MAG: tRNA uridine-5-carboxymethylaminomethyl(34) synthesis GTPase MnmE [Thermodesulfobacteriota bacterium]